MKASPLFVLGCLSVVGAKAEQTQRPRPNVILIMTDQQRFDCMGVINESIITPHLDSLAADGMLFENGYTASPSSTPARSVLLTGMTPWHAGMIGYSAKVAERYEHELPQMLSDAGYQTVAVGKMHWWPQRNGHGFQTLIVDESGRVETPEFVSDYRQWFAQAAPGINPDSTGLSWNGHEGRMYALPEKLHPTQWTGDVAVAQIKDHDPSKPLFLKVSFARPHSPYDPPRRYVDMYKGRNIPTPWVGDWCAKYADRPMTTDAAFGDFGVEHALNSRRHYYAATTFIDDQIGRVIQTLKDQGLYENSVIIFTSDHGDMMGDHHHWRKTYPYEGSAHIPFIVKLPSKMRAGTVRNECVDLRDIMPTFLSAAGVAVPENVDGQSLLDIGTGRPWREYIEMEHSSTYESKSGWVALTDGKIKYIWYYNKGEQRMFNMVDDAHELHDIASDAAYQSIRDLWYDRMVQTLTERGDKWVKVGRLQVVASESPLNENYPK